MKILYVISSLDIGGAEVLLQRTANILSKEHDVFILYLKGNGSLVDELDSRVQVRKILWGIFGVFQFKDVLKSYDPDVVHTHLLPADVFLLTVPRSTKCRLFTTIHNIGKGDRIRDWITKWIYRLLDKVLGNSHSIICVSDAVKRYMLTSIGIKAEKITVIKNGIVLPKSVTRVPEASKFRLLFVGRLVNQKDPLTVVEIGHLLHEKNVVFEITIVGGGPKMSELEEKIAQYNLSPMVRCAGESKNLPDFYTAADVLLVPSIVEGFGLVAVEAMSYGVPVLANKVGGLCEVVIHEQNGYFCSNVEDYVSRICELNNDSELLRSLSRQCFNTVSRFDLELSVQSILRLYER